MQVPINDQIVEVLTSPKVEGKLTRSHLLYSWAIMPKKYALCSDEELLQMLETSARIQGQLEEKGSVGKANSQHGIMVKLSCELIRRGNSAQQGILSLLKSGDPHVRAWAAFLALEFDASKGEEVLEEIAQDFPRGLGLGFSAKVSLERWRKGELRTLSQWGCKGKESHSSQLARKDDRQMDGRKFALMAKQYAVDGVVKEVVNELKGPRLPKKSKESSNPVEQSISKWISSHALVAKKRSEWFNQLPKEEQGILKEILENCAEMSVANFFCLLDGVGGPYEGVFEIVAIGHDDRREVLNPENSDMLHDLFSAVCEENRNKN